MALFVSPSTSFEPHFRLNATGSFFIVWAIKRFIGYLWSTKLVMYLDHKALESIGKVVEHNARVQRWLEYLCNFTYTLEYRKTSTNGNPDFLA